MIQPINITQNTNIQLPTAQRNYTVFDKKRVDDFVSQKEQALPYLKQVLQTSQDEKQIIEALYVTDRLIDAGTKGIPHMYPIFARFNDTQSAGIQSFLAGIYRKTQVPDAFGPLVSMLIKNSLQKSNTVGLASPTYSSNLLLQRISGQALQPSEHQNLPFDPNEEIGGAILAYITNYAKGTPKIDYSA